MTAFKNSILFTKNERRKLSKKYLANQNTERRQSSKSAKKSTIRKERNLNKTFIFYNFFLKYKILIDKNELYLNISAGEKQQQ